MTVKTTEQLIAECIEKLGDSNPVVSLLGEGILTVENAKPLVVALQEQGARVGEFSVRFRQVEDGALAALLEPLNANGHIATVNISGFHPGTQDSAAIAGLVGSDIPLKELRLTRTQLGDDDMKPIVNALTHQPKLRAIDLSLNPLSTDILDAFAPVLPAMHDLLSFNLPDMELLPEMREALSEALDESTHPNLRTASLALGDGMLQRNRDTCKELLEELPQTPAALADYSLAKMREVERRLPAIEASINGDMLLDAKLLKYYGQFSELPDLPIDRPIRAEDLVAPTVNNLTQLHHPRLFADHPDLLTSMLESGALNSETLCAATPQGIRIIDHLAAFSPAAALLETLNEHGIDVHTPALWADEAGEKTQATHFLLQQPGGLEALFDGDHWADAAPRDLRSVLGALSETEYDAVPNRHALMAACRPLQRGGRQA